MPFPSLREVLLPPFPSLSYGSIQVEGVESYTSVLRLGWVVGKYQSRRPGEGDAVQQTQLQLSSPEHPLHARACGEQLSKVSLQSPLMVTHKVGTVGPPFLTDDIQRDFTMCPAGRATVRI